MGRPLPPSSTEPRHVFVDLDGTLVRGDMSVESAWRYLAATPWRILVLLIAAVRGRAAFKTVVARRVRIDPVLLPYEEELLAYLRKAKSEGRRLVLITASHWTYARRIAKHLGLFDEVHGSTAKINLKGRMKLARIRELVGPEPFIYAGDSIADRPIWQASTGAIFVNGPARDIADAESEGRKELSIRTRHGTFKNILREMRLHQWAKNALLFVPLLTSHSYSDLSKIEMALIAFLCFGLCASGHYFLNDMLDLEADRAHATKRFRPLASGQLPLLWGFVGAIVLPAAAFALSLLLLPKFFSIVLAAYFVLTNLYSFYLKHVSTADVFALAVLYTVRVVAGAAAIAVVLSSWLLSFSVFIFLSLGYLKRYIELAPAEADKKVGGRGYSGADADVMFVLGIANATASVIVFAFYIASPEVRVLYKEPDLLWALCILMLYWTNRIWIGAKRGKIHGDPVVFALRDRVSRLVGLLSLLIVIGAHLAP